MKEVKKTLDGLLIYIICVFMIAIVCFVAGTIASITARVEYVYYVKSEEAKVYAEPNSYSRVISSPSYGNEVKVIESTKMWDKIEYVDITDGKKVTGWIAKINLCKCEDYVYKIKRD